MMKRIDNGVDACAHVQTEKWLRDTRPKRAKVGDNETRPWNIEELENQGSMKRFKL